MIWSILHDASVQVFMSLTNKLPISSIICSVFYGNNKDINDTSKETYTFIITLDLTIIHFGCQSSVFSAFTSCSVNYSVFGRTLLAQSIIVGLKQHFLLSQL